MLISCSIISEQNLHDKLSNGWSTVFVYRPEEGRHDTSASKFIYTLIAYFSACQASKESSIKRLWCWRVPRMLVIGVLIDVTILYVS